MKTDIKMNAEPAKRGQRMEKQTEFKKNENGMNLSQPVQVVELEETDSTNRVAKELAAQGVPEGTLVVAKRQSGGRGRMGRSFFSPEGGIYMSMILRPEIPADRAILITTCAAVAVARAIENVCKETVGIKWVNDIFIKNKKVCGILAEGEFSTETEGFSYVVLGIGINVKRQTVPEELKEIVGCLEEYSEYTILKEELISAVWCEFFSLYDTLSTAVYMEEYKERSVLLGKEVTVCAANGDYKAVVTDIDKEGRLGIRRGDTVEYLSSGEISVRL